MAERKKKVTSAVMVVEYKVVKNRRGSIELSNNFDGLKSIGDNGSVVELPTIQRSGTPRSDIIPSRQSSARRGSRQEEILKSMIDQLSTTGSSTMKTPTCIPTQLQNALLKRGPTPQKGRRMSVQERIVIMKDTPASRCGSANSKALIARRNTEPMLAFVQNNTIHNTNNNTTMVRNGSGLRSDGNTTNTTGSSSNVYAQENLMQTKTERDPELLSHKADDIVEEEEVDPNSPGVKLSIEKCKSWIRDLPEKFSGLNVLTFPDIQSSK